MAFDWKTFLITLAEVGPAAIVLGKSIAAEVPTASTNQIASDSLHAATGIVSILLPAAGAPTQDTAAANLASTLIQSYINILLPAKTT